MSTVESVGPRSRPLLVQCRALSYISEKPIWLRSPSSEYDFSSADSLLNSSICWLRLIASSTALSRSSSRKGFREKFGWLQLSSRAQS